MSGGHKPAVQHMVGNEDRCSRAAVKHINEACKNHMKGATVNEGPARFQVAAVPEVRAIKKKTVSSIWVYYCTMKR